MGTLLGMLVGRPAKVSVLGCGCDVLEGFLEEFFGRMLEWVVPLAVREV